MPTLYDNFSQVRQYIDENNTSYVTKTELANASYVTSSQLSDCSYATTSYVADYVATYGGGVIDENIIPKETSTYTLGDESHLYAATYTSKLWLNSGNVIYNDNNYQIVLKLNNSDKYVFRTEYIRPISNNGSTLGTASFNFSSTYTSNLYLNNNNALYNKTQYQVNLKLNGGDKYVFRTNHLSPASDGGSDLGQSDLHWNNAYINNAYISNYNNLIWTGTAAEYTALSDYTTYNLYLIQSE